MPFYNLYHLFAFWIVIIYNKYMIKIVEVKTRKEKNLFIDFPTRLYEGNKYYVHPLRGG